MSFWQMFKKLPRTHNLSRTHNWLLTGLNSNQLERRNEEVLQPPIATLGEIDSAYQRQLRRKELLKQKMMAKKMMAKKMFEEEQGKLSCHPTNI